jgi:hypothetical protein
MTRILYALVLLALASIPAHASDGFYRDGYQLLQACQAAERSGQAISPREEGGAAVDVGVCIGYIEGAIDAFTIADRSVLACAPNNIRLGQAKLIVRNYLAAHPEKLHWTASLLVTAALFEAFPCSDSRR